MRTLLLTTAALAAFIPAAAACAEEVGELIVTATRLPTDPQWVTGARVIEREELAARQSAFATDILATVPGVAIARNGAFGGIGAIRIRGATPDKTLVLVDGVPVNDPADPNGAYDPASVQVDDLERIEVLSGPQSSLWGSDAIGGVVAFTTRELTGWRLSAEGGSFGTARGFAAAGVSKDAYALDASVTGFHTDGISKAASGTEKDGFDTVTLNVGGRLSLAQVRLDGRVRYTDSDIDIDGFAPPDFFLGDTQDRNTSKTWSGFGRATFDALGLTHQLSFSGYDLTRDNISDFPSKFTADRQVWRWTAARGEASDPVAFVLGAERNDTDADLSGRDSIDLSNTAAFAVARARLAERLTLTGSVRYDDPDRFKGRATGRLSAAVEAGAGFTVTASAGQGFKTPTISQVICDFCFPAGPSTDLKPEKADGYDLRLGWRSPDEKITAAVTGYKLKVRDQIAYAGRYVNIARTRSTGVEAEADVQLSETLRLKLAYAWMDAIDASTNASLIRVPDRSGAAALFWEKDRWSGALTARAESSQSDTDVDGFSRIVRKGFVTADIAGAYEVNDHVTITARIENLADEDYQETFGYGEPGRAAYIGIRLKN
ncbi:MAG: TonB-dependent receptor [Phenylobacterium sp.]